MVAAGETVGVCTIIGPTPWDQGLTARDGEISTGHPTPSTPCKSRGLEIAGSHVAQSGWHWWLVHQ
jgi:hypothetical protein